MPQHSNRPSLYEDVDEKELVEQLIKSPSEQWPSGLPAPWLGEAIYQLPLDNNLEWSHLQQQQQQQQQQRQNLLRFSSSSSNSEEPKVMTSHERQSRLPGRNNENVKTKQFDRSRSTTTTASDATTTDLHGG